MNAASYFSLDVSEYMRLNGFVKINTKGMHDGMLWQKDESRAVYFWQNRIELHIKNAVGDWHVKNTYIGFDGHNMQHLIMILHCMGAITIQDANKLAQEHVHTSDQLEKIYMSMPLTGLTRQN